ncbi:Regulatory protein recX [Desulfosporosinus sp. BG]|nr:Regulatory protein recX [Desulfosporosinus sp. BG]
MIHLTSSKPLKSAREVALDCLSRRALTHYELKTRLMEKGYESSEISEVLEKMENLGYINDQELALTVSQNRLRRYSRRRVLQDLQNRGLVSQVIEQALEATYSSGDEFQQCLTLAKRWWVQEGERWDQKVHEKDSKRQVPRDLWLQQKVARKLIQRGYPSDMVRKVLYQIKTTNNRDDETLDPR